MSEPKTLLDWALFALSKGWSVFPCKPRSKEPNPRLAPHGVHNASKDEGVVRAWYAEEPETNPAIALGPSNLTVMDVDEGLADLDAAREWFRTVKLPATFTVLTGRRTSCGIQLYWNGLAANRPYNYGSIKGEIRSAGYYVMAPGAIHDKSGEAYAILNHTRPAEIPTLIKELTKEKAPRPQGGPTKLVEPSWRHYFLVERARELYFAGLAGNGLENALKWLYEHRCQKDPVKDQRINTNEVYDICAWIGAHPPEYPLEPNDFVKMRFAAKGDDLFKAAWDGQLSKFENDREKAIDYMLQRLIDVGCSAEQAGRIVRLSPLETESIPLPSYDGIDF